MAAGPQQDAPVVELLNVDSKVSYSTHSEVAFMQVLGTQTSSLVCGQLRDARAAGHAIGQCYHDT